MSALAKIHIAKKQLGLDDDTYRAVLLRVVGKESSRDMSAAEHGRLLAEFERLGFNPASKAPRKGGKVPAKSLAGPYAKKLQALWIAGWNLGLIFDRQDSALLAFVSRQTGIERTDWLRDAASAQKAIEALKSWLARDGGVNWSVERLTPEHKQRHGYQIAAAQWLRLFPSGDMGAFWVEVSAILKRSIVTTKPTDAEWITVMNTLGRRLRDTLEKRKAA